MNRRGFTLVELAICLSITIILAPLLYRLALSIEDRALMGLWYLDTADAVRTVAEELRLDRSRAAPLPGDELRFPAGDCEFRYHVQDDQILVRQTTPACGASRSLARHVERLSQIPGGVEITFARQLRTNRTHHATVFIPLESE